MKRTGSVLGLAGVVALAFIGAATSAQTPPAASGKATVLTLSSTGLTIKGKLGSYCLPLGERASVCADAVFDPKPTRGRLPVRARGRVAITTGAAANLVTFQLIRADTKAPEPEFTSKSLRARPLGSSGRRWVVRLPADLKRADLVNVFVRYPNGDASFGARVDRDSVCGASG